MVHIPLPEQVIPQSLPPSPIAPTCVSSDHVLPEFFPIKRGKRKSEFCGLRVYVILHKWAVLRKI